MRHRDPRPRKQLLQLRLDPADGFDAVVHEEDLASSLELRLDGLADHLSLARHDLRLDRQPVAGRRLDDGQVSQAREREMQRARDGRRRHREDVDGGLPSLQLLLLGDAEALLLVHDQEAQVAEREVLAQHPVRRDQDVHGALGDFPDRVRLLRARAETREQLDRHREGGEAAAEGAEVLVGEDRGRREHGDLLAVQDGLEGRAHRDLGLAVTDVAAEEPVHRLVRLHVALDVGDRLRLVGGLDVLEGVFELLLPGGVLGEGEAGREPAARVELQKLVGHVAHRLLHRGLAPAPPGSAQPVERGRDAFDPRVLLHEVEAVHRQEQRLLLRVADLHELALFSFDEDAFQTLEEADAVVAVDDRVAQLQVAQVREERLGRAAPGDRGPLFLPEDLALRVEGEGRLTQPEPGGDLPGHADENALAALGGDVQAVLEREPAQLLGPARGLDGDEDLLAGGERPRKLRRGLRGAAPVAGHGLRRNAQERARCRCRQPDPVERKRRAREVFADRGRGTQQLVRGERVPLRVPVGGEPLLEGADFLQHGGRLEHRHQGARGVVEPARGHGRDRRGEDQPLDLRGRSSDAVLHGAPRLFGLLGSGEGRDRDARQALAGALGVGIEDADRSDPVAVELDANRQVAVGRKEVEEPPAHREVARLGDEVPAPVPQARQPRDEIRQRDLLPFRQGDEEPRERGGRGQPREERAGGQHERLDRSRGRERRRERELSVGAGA